LSDVGPTKRGVALAAQTDTDARPFRFPPTISAMGYVDKRKLSMDNMKESLTA